VSRANLQKKSHRLSPVGLPVSMVFSALLLSACGGRNNTSTMADAATLFDLQRSDEGIALIKAPTLEAASAGLGYAYATDNFCLLQDYLLSVNGERSKYLGPDATVLTQVAHVNSRNIESDFFYKFYIDAKQADQLYATADSDTKALITGYVAGVNRALLETPSDKIDVTCRGKPWLRPMTLTDMHKMLLDRAILASGANFIEPIAAAKPPQASATVTQVNATNVSLVDPASLSLLVPPLASNAWAFGRDKVEGGGALLFGNPHFPWVTTNRFYEARMTVPGVYDVVGATLGGFPIITIGYNKDFAWSHTVSTGKRFTIYELTLKPGDPLTYIVDGVEKRMEPVDVAVEVLAGGAVSAQTRRLYKTDFGAVLTVPTAGLAWSAQNAYTLSDVNLTNNRMLRTWLQVGQARSAREAQAALSKNLGLPWVNTIGADASGEVLYADITPIPNVDAADIARCLPSPRAAALLNVAGLVVLNGSTVQCRWTIDSGTPAPGLMPASKLASAIRTDFVANSNDSYWLANPAITWPGASPLLGPLATAQRPRTRAALTAFQRRFAGTDGMSGNLMNAAKLQTIWYSNENYVASIVLDDLLALCPANPIVTLSSGMAIPTAAACSALSAWDRRSDRDSRGAHLFREFWRAASAVRNVYALPFNPQDPVETPRGLNTSDPAVNAAILQSFGNAINTVLAAGVAIDAPLGSLQFFTVNGQSIPLSGSEEFEGAPNKLETRGFINGSYEPFLGSSYVQVVDYSNKILSARGILTHSQSTNPASPYFGNQLRSYSDKQLYTFPSP
jgi:acyl-homoserine-lactone acylase